MFSWLLVTNLNTLAVILHVHRTWYNITTAACECVEIFCVNLRSIFSMMTSSNGNIFRVTGHLCGQFTGHRWIPRTKASDAEFWCFLWSAPCDASINGWVNNGEAGDLICHHAHYDVIVMSKIFNKNPQRLWWRRCGGFSFVSSKSD